MGKEDLSKILTAEYLKDISVTIINAYRTKRIAVLRSYADHLFPAENSEEQKANTLFLKLIKHFHPDRLQLLRNEIETARKENDLEKLTFFSNLLTAKNAEEKLHYKNVIIDVEEEYRYGTEDFGYDTADFNEEESREEEDLQEEYTEPPDTFDFIRAVKLEHLGNLDYILTSSDLSFLEGELTLAGYNLSELGGLEYCTSITTLDLSDNNIANIYEIQFIEHLRELFLSHNQITDIDYIKDLSFLEVLDLSFNEIEDISILSGINSLTFVNLSGNPVENNEIIEELRERSVIVIL